MRTPETPTASSTPEHPVTDAVPDSAATPRDYPIQQGRPFAAPAEYDALRVAAEDIELSGLTVPADDGVIAPLAGANHDPEQFDDPQRVDFHRTDNHHVAFGYGVHQCVGQHLARLELEVALETPIRRAPTLRLAGERDEVAVKHDSATFGLEELMVTW